MVRKTGRPGYLQIADDLREQIRGGSLPPGSPLPSTTQLAEQYDASLSVVKLAVGILRTEGLVIGQQGKGVFVREDVPDTDPGPHGRLGRRGHRATHRRTGPVGTPGTGRRDLVSAIRELGPPFRTFKPVTCRASRADTFPEATPPRMALSSRRMPSRTVT